MTASRRCYLLHNEEGRILAIAPIATVRTNDGVECGFRPVPKAHQTLAEVNLEGEHAELSLADLLQFEVVIDAKTGRPSLKRPR